MSFIWKLNLYLSTAPDYGTVNTSLFGLSALTKVISSCGLE
jgi:hypothetical protein